MYINHNGMASNVANTLTSHYSNLATSTQRLSSGLRVNSAADDAAGLAIRELMRADISALNQGVRNANDAISMIQTADGALGIIDEKLIRMKELAEQAATGTYDSTQRLMIESEYQQMASEITRIANSTDFNGMKLLDGTLEGTHDGSNLTATGAMKIHFGTGNDSAEDYYYVEIGEVTAAALGVGNQSTWEDVQNRAMDAFEKSLKDQIKNSNLSDEDKGKLLANIGKLEADGKYTEGSAMRFLSDTLENAMEPHNAYDLWAAKDPTDPMKQSDIDNDEGFWRDGKVWEGNSDLMHQFLAAGGKQSPNAIFMEYAKAANNGADWATATTAANAAATASDDEIFMEFAKTANGGADWTTAETAAKAAVATDDNILAEYSKTTDMANAKADNTGWTAAETAAGAGASDDDIYLAYAKAANGGADWTAAKTAVEATVEDEDILAEYAKTTDMATAKTTNAGADWAVAKTAADAAATASEEEILAVYAQTTSIKDAQADTAGWEAATTAAGDAAIDAAALDDFMAGLRDTQLQKLKYAFGQAALYNLANADQNAITTDFGIGADGTFPASFIGSLSGDGQTEAADFLNNALKAAHEKVKDMDFAGFTIETQEDAQHALVALNDAIVQKDKVRAHLGALQNRLENTVSNLTIQAENLQASESRISDVDVATEMTNFVRNQILTQSAVAMLSQANSMPQMAMQLIG